MILFPCRNIARGFRLSLGISNRLLDCKYSAQSQTWISIYEESTPSCHHIELVDILKRSIEKKAVKVLNELKAPETPWEVYDTATRVEYEMVKRQGQKVPIRLSKSMQKSIIKLDYETLQARLKLYAKFRDSEELDDALTLHKLEKQRLRRLEVVDRVKEIDPSLSTSGKFTTSEGYHVLGPRLKLDAGFSMARADHMSKGNLNFAIQFGQNFVIGKRGVGGREY